MKIYSILPFLILMLVFQEASSQCNCTMPVSNGSILNEPYNSAVNWTYVGPPSPPICLSTGSMSVSANVMNYNLPSGNGYNRMWRTVPGLSANSQSFVAECQATITGGNSPGHYIMSFVEFNNVDPTHNFNPCLGGLTTNDGLFVILEKINGVPTGPACCTDPNLPGQPWQFKIRYKDGNGNLQDPPGNGINMLPNPNAFGTYFVRLIRNNCRAYLQVTTDANFTNHIPGSPVCVDIPASITNFNFVNQGVSSSASENRTVQMTVDNLLISPYTGGCTPITITATPNPSCSGEQVSLTANGGFAGDTYLWSTGATTPSISPSPVVNTTYTVTVTSPFGCSTVVSQTVTVNPVPYTYLGPDQTVCAPINISTPACAGCGYQWTFPAGYSCLFGGNNAQACITGNYCVTTTNTNGCSTTDCAYITVNSTPSGTITYNPTNPCPGDPVSMGVLTSCTTCTYLWSNGATTANTTVNPTTSTTYTVTITNSAGCSTTISQLVNVSNCTPVQFCRYISDGVAASTRDRGEAVINTADGGIALVGSLFQATTDDDIYFVKYSSNMTPQCSLRLGDLVSGAIYRESGFAVMEASDGFYYVAGTVTVAAGNTDVFVLKLNLTNCNTNPIVWSQRFGQNTFNESAVQIVEMPTAVSTVYDLLVVGSAFSAATSASDILAVKISSTGSYIDSRVYYPVGTPTTNEFGRDAIRLANSPGRYIIVGDSREPTNNAIIISIDQSLVMGAFATIDGGRNESAQSVVERGSELFVVGRSNQFTTDNDVVVFRMNASLTGAINGYTYGTATATTREIGYSIKNTSSGNLIVAGSCYESTATNLNGLLLQINPANMGAGYWAKKTSQAGYYLQNDEFSDIVEISTGNFVVTGYTGLSATDEEIFIGKFDNLTSGLNECCLLNYPMTTNSYYHIGPNMDQKQVSFQKNTHGTRAYYYAELNTCSQYSSFKMQGEQVMQNPEVAIQEIKIYPNPSTGIFKFQTTGIWEETIKLRIFDSSGRLIISDKIISGSNNMFEFDGRNLKEGIYFVEVLTDGGKFRSKISIQK